MKEFSTKSAIHKYVTCRDINWSELTTRNYNAYLGSEMLVRV